MLSTTPTMQFGLESNKDIRVWFFKRRVTNVDPAPKIYSATIRSPKGVEITVKPTSLIFSKTLQKMSFKKFKVVVIVKDTFIAK